MTLAFYIFIMGAIVIIMILLLILQLRNEIVYRVRNRAIAEDWSLYDKLPSYDKMIWQFNKWTYKQFCDK